MKIPANTGFCSMPPGRIFPRMDAKRILSELCWFSASCLAVGSVILVFVAIDRSVIAWSITGYALLVEAATALVVMGVLMAAALRLDEREG